MQSEATNKIRKWENERQIWKEYLSKFKFQTTGIEFIPIFGTLSTLMYNTSQDDP